MKNKTRIVLDMTEFNSWSGHLTGIQRVVGGILEGFDEKATVLVTFDEKIGDFVEIERQQIDEVITQKVAELYSVEPSGKKAELKQFAKKVYRKLPTGVKGYLNEDRRSHLKKLANKALDVRKQLLGRSNGVTLAVDNSQVFNFSADDVLVSAGRSWDNKRALDKMVALSNESGAKLGFVVYDLIPIYQQHTFGHGLVDRFSEYLFTVLTSAEYLFPISESTKNDLGKYADELGFLKAPIMKTIRLGDSINTNELSQKPRFIKSDQPFAVSVGTIEARKNIMELYFAYKLAFEKSLDLPILYIIGKPGWLTSDTIFFIQNDLSIKDKMIIVNDVNDAELAWLYKNAHFTLYVSQYEGWGLPIAESLAIGTPCIASHSSSMTEIDKDLTDFVSPYDPAQLVEKMSYYAQTNNSLARRKVIEANYKLTDWSVTSNAILKQVN